MMPFIFTYDLDPLRSLPLQNLIVGHNSVTNVNGQNIAKFTNFNTG